MALDWKKIYFPFVGGINKKIDDKVLSPPVLETMDNGILSKAGTVEQRNGYTAYSTNDDGLTPITARARNIATRGAEDILIHEDRIYTHDVTGNNWVPRGDFHGPTLSSSVTADRKSNQINPSQARFGRVVVTAWMDEVAVVGETPSATTTINKVAYQVTDAVTGAVYVAPTVIGHLPFPASTTRYHHPHVINDGVNLRIWVMDGGETLRYYTIDTVNPTQNDFSLSVAGTNLTDPFSGGGTAYYDIVPSRALDGSVYIARYYNNTPSRQLAVFKINSAGTVTNLHSLVLSGEQVKLLAISTDPYGSGRVGLAWINHVDGANSESFRVQMLSSTLSTVFGVTIIDSTGTGGPTDIGTAVKALMVNWIDSAKVDVIYGGMYPSVSFPAMLLETRHTHVDDSGAITLGPATLTRGASPSARPFYVNNRAYTWFSYDSPLQSTDFLLRDDGFIVAKSMQGLARGYASAPIPYTGDVGGTLADKDKSLASKYIIDTEDISATLKSAVLPFKTRLDTSVNTTMSETDNPTTELQNNPVFSGYGIRQVLLNFDDAQGFQWKEAGGVNHINGGFLWQYDGVKPVESGFHLFPETYRAFKISGTGGLGTGAYAYRIYYEWTNATGQRERSSTSGAVTTTGAGAGNEARVVVNALWMTGKSGVSIVIYRTEENPAFDSPFYRVSSDDHNKQNVANGYVSNDAVKALAGAPAVFEFVDTMSDAVLVRQELDPLNGGQLDNIAPPAPTVLAEGKDRIFLASHQDSAMVRYSKLRSDGGPYEFNDALLLPLEDTGGRITGIAILNESVVIFKETRIYVVSGQGPNNLGLGSFSQPQRVSSDVGCINSRSIVQTVDGVMFQSSRGVYLLTQQYLVEYVGAPVEGLVGTISRAILDDDSHRVMFLNSDPAFNTLCYDTFFRQWFVFTNHNGLGAIQRSGLLQYLRTDKRTVYLESTTVEMDAGVAIDFRNKTSWFKVEGLQNFQRVASVYLLGKYKRPHVLQLTVEYDYIPTVVSTFLYDPGATPVVPYEARFDLQIQKCKAVRFGITRLPRSPATIALNAVEFTELAMRVGLKNTLDKVAPKGAAQ